LLKILKESSLLKAVSSKIIDNRDKSKSINTYESGEGGEKKKRRKK